jgi:hypothetical protein
LLRRPPLPPPPLSPNSIPTVQFRLSPRPGSCTSASACPRPRSPTAAANSTA